MDEAGNPRSVSDLQTKVAALQLCGESVAAAGEVCGTATLARFAMPAHRVAVQVFKRMPPLSYFIRRIVCPAVLVNCADARIMLPSIFKAVLGIARCSHY